ncbi:hypothetical protein ACLOJK_038414 [Asimina triloba]
MRLSALSFSLRLPSLVTAAMANDFKSIPAIDISPLLEKYNDPKMGEDRGVLEVVGMLDKACTETGFFYVVLAHSVYFVS